MFFFVWLITLCMRLLSQPRKNKVQSQDIFCFNPCISILVELWESRWINSVVFIRACVIRLITDMVWKTCFSSEDLSTWIFIGSWWRHVITLVSSLKTKAASCLLSWKYFCVVIEETNVNKVFFPNICTTDLSVEACSQLLKSSVIDTLGLHFVFKILKQHLNFIFPLYS